MTVDSNGEETQSIFVAEEGEREKGVG